MNYLQFFNLVLVCVITHIIRSTYEILKHKKILQPTGLSFVIIFLDMAVLWVSWFALCSFDEYKMILPGIIKYIGLLLISIGLVIFITALFTIKTLENYEGDLITKGIYSKIRHPMYLGFILWCIGMPVYSSAYFSLILAFVFVGNILFWRHLEEIDLEKRFVDYNLYKLKTFF
jgi:protein-S-isoprenylcysteine O-methyltransferase Ste14